MKGPKNHFIKFIFFSEEKVTETRLDLDCFDAILFHTPFCKIVQKSLGRLVLCEYLDKLPHSQRDAKFEPLQTLAAGYGTVRSGVVAVEGTIKL